MCTYFPALGTSYMLCRVWHTPVIYFPAFGTSCTFQFPLWYWLHIFPRLATVKVFPLWYGLFVSSFLSLRSDWPIELLMFVVIGQVFNALADLLYLCLNSLIAFSCLSYRIFLIGRDYYKRLDSKHLRSINIVQALFI